MLRIASVIAAGKFTICYKLMARHSRCITYDAGIFIIELLRIHLK